MTEEKPGSLKVQYSDGAIAVFLTIAVFLVFSQVGGHDFTNFDDPLYVTENPKVLSGLSADNVAWAFTTLYANFWHPLTWLSYMLDTELYGTGPGGYLFTNLILHLLNTLLLFTFFRWMTGKSWASGFVAALFAFHPLHVESVAWVAERKDVLSTFFWMLTMLGYVWYVQLPSVGRYLVVFFIFAMGLMAKPMLVTLPCVLLLLDYWPLGRMFEPADAGNANSVRARLARTPSGRRLMRLFIEKIPLFFLAAVVSVLAYIAQNRGAALASLDSFPLDVRIANALVAYSAYIVKFIWPVNLAVYYPHPGIRPLGQIVAAALFFLVMMSIAFTGARRFPWFTVGWLWYVGTLVPVIGIVQIGSFAMADRFTYIPFIGLFVIVAWSGSDFIKKRPASGPFIASVGMTVLVALMLGTYFQVKHWQDSVSLFRHTLAVTENNHLAHSNLGEAYREKGRLAEAILEFQEAVRIIPSDSQLHCAIAALRLRQGRLEEAVRILSRALEIDPGRAEIHNDLGYALLGLGKTDQAVFYYRKTLAIDPGNAKALNGLGVALLYQGRIEAATGYFKAALKVNPDYEGARRNLDKVSGRSRR